MKRSMLFSAVCVGMLLTVTAQAHDRDDWRRHDDRGRDEWRRHDYRPQYRGWYRHDGYRHYGRDYFYGPRHRFYGSRVYYPQPYYYDRSGLDASLIVSVPLF